VGNDNDMAEMCAGHLFKLRLVVGRVGELDIARWWNTEGQLGSLGASVIRRGFVRTHYFAQARTVFAVAAQRCREVYDPPGSVTLWSLPPELEDKFDVRWEHWLDSASDWSEFFTGLEKVSEDVEVALLERDLVTEDHLEQLRQLRRSADMRAVELPGEFTGTNDDITMLALAFARGEPGKLAVPYQSWSQL